MRLQGELPSTLLNVIVVKGEVKVVPVVSEEECHTESHEFWENPIFLTEGDAGKKYSQSCVHVKGGGKGLWRCIFLSTITQFERKYFYLILKV